MRTRTFYVYFMTTRLNSALYVGVTSNLEGRVRQHKQQIIPGFTKRYHVTKLVYYEEYSYPNEAIVREKQIKGWTRNKKNALIISLNPKWEDLAKDWSV